MIHLYVSTTYKCIMSPRISAAESRVNEARGDSLLNESKGFLGRPAGRPLADHCALTAMDLRKLNS